MDIANNNSGSNPRASRIFTGGIFGPSQFLVPPERIFGEHVCSHRSARTILLQGCDMWDGVRVVYMFLGEMGVAQVKQLSP